MEIKKMTLNEDDLDILLDALFHRHPNEYGALRLALMNVREGLIRDKSEYPNTHFAVELRTVIRADAKE